MGTSRPNHFRLPGLFFALASAFFLISIPGVPASGRIHVAVASNFSQAVRQISERFEKATGHEVVLSFGSTGKLYAQIRNGAPFHAFLAADAERPARLEDEGLAEPGSRFTYVVGNIVLWSPRAGFVDSDANILETRRFRHLALANPKLAPYGRAAREVLRARGLWEALQDRMVRGENIAQTYQFVKSGSAELGFVAFSQIKRPGRPVEGSYWEVPQTLYSPIEQQAVLLRGNNPVARAFLSFMRQDESLRIIRDFGYGTP
jgi:molybdate transport system substrate-binding protein